jgi:hypothetical protein
LKNNDGVLATLITLKGHSDLVIHNSKFDKNSAYLRGVAISTIDKESTVQIYDSNFDNNNGLFGG